VVVRGQRGRRVRRRRRPREAAGPAEALHGRHVTGLGQQLDADGRLTLPLGPGDRFDESDWAGIAEKIDNNLCAKRAFEAASDFVYNCQIFI
jgi:hypothetical protein